MVQLDSVIKAIGPNAAIIFAAWIFMGFLQQRYDSAIDRYRTSVGDYRSEEHEGDRGRNLKEQVLSYRRRCKMMAWANLIGLVAAIVLISSLILNGVNTIAPGLAAVTICGIVTAIGGLILVIAATLIVIGDGWVVSRQIDDELRDVPDLADEAGQRRGTTKRQR